MSNAHHNNDGSREGEFLWFYRGTPEQLAALDHRHPHSPGVDRDEYTALRRFHERRGFWSADDPAFDGVDGRGFSLSGHHIQTQADRDADGYNWRGIDRDGYNERGWNQRGFDRDGTHRNGTLRDDNGLDADGYAKDGFNADDRTGRTAFPARDRQGFNLRGWDENDRNRHGQFQGSARESIWWVSLKVRPHYLPEGWKKTWRSVFPYTRQNVRPDDIYIECTYGARAPGGAVTAGTRHLSLHWRARECFVLGQRLADDRRAGVATPHMDSFTVRWIDDLEALRGDAVREMPRGLGFERENRQMMALALRAGLGYAEPTRRELIELGYEEPVRHYAPTLKWRKRSKLGSAA
ncbi:MAG: hypothetical protein J0H96_13025 [Microbacterium ginsengisoli]|nr:hypothetical protein [Microbacterium ginsengisoli]